MHFLFFLLFFYIETFIIIYYYHNSRTKQFWEHKPRINANDDLSGITERQTANMRDSDSEEKREII